MVVTYGIKFLLKFSFVCSAHVTVIHHSVTVNYQRHNQIKQRRLSATLQGAKEQATIFGNKRTNWQCRMQY